MYGGFVLALLWLASPIRTDGGGSIATFYWGNHPPSASIIQYYQDGYVRLHFYLPYAIAAILFAALGCGISRFITLRLRPRLSHLFLAPAGICFLLLLFVATFADLGTVFHLWIGPLIWHVPPLLAFITVPAASAVGLLIYVRELLNQQTEVPQRQQNTVNESGH
jgi:hypothetical protein